MTATVPRAQRQEPEPAETVTWSCPDEHIRRIVDAAPPLSAEQIAALRGLLPAPYVHRSAL